MTKVKDLNFFKYIPKMHKLGHHVNEKFSNLITTTLG